MSSAAEEYYVHPTSIVDQPCKIGAQTKIWHFCHISQGASIGEACSFGQNCFVASGVTIGSRVKVQNNVSIYTGTTIEDDVFLGPSCVLTNVSNPRSQVLRHSLYEPTVIRRGATIGANATIVCGVDVGQYAFIAAGAVVTRSVPNYAFIMGVPGRQIGWMSRHGHRLNFDESGAASCPESGLKYSLRDGRVRCSDVAEEDPLPAHLSVGRVPYRGLKS